MVETAARLLYLRAEELARQIAVAIAGQGRRPRIALINGIQHAALNDLAASAEELIVQQGRRDNCLELQRAGCTVRRSISGTNFDLVLVLGGRQREQTLGWLGAAAGMLETSAAPHGGTLLFCSANDMGAKGYERKLASLGAPISVQSKSKCRVSELHGEDISNRKQLAKWLSAAEPRRITLRQPAGMGGEKDEAILSCPGVFSWDRADAGSRLLLDHLPDKLAGRGMDLGCGNGYLSCHVLASHEGIREWHLVDVDAVALDCARQNLAALEREQACKVQGHWLDATRESMPGGMDVVLLNPPFHKDKADLVSLGQSMIRAAARSMKPAGSLFLVANRHLPYEFLLYDTFGQVQVLFEGKGYKVVRCDGVSR